MVREINYSEVFDSQKIFRKILDSMARPGKINNLVEVRITPPLQLNTSSALIGFALLNPDVSFYSVNNQDEVNEYLKVNTSSTPALSINDADFVFIHGNAMDEIIGSIKKGELEYPEDNATLIIDVEKIETLPTDQSCQLILRGPGVKSEEIIYIKGIANEILAEIKNANNEYPLGIDVILSDKEGNIICIPRTNNFSWN